MIVKLAVENFKNRNQDIVNIPDMKTHARVGYSVEAIKKCLDGVTNSHVDETGTTMPLVGAGKYNIFLLKEVARHRNTVTHGYLV